MAARMGCSTVTGVDISKQRLFTARSMVRKYAAGKNIRLFCTDARSFCEPPVVPLALGTLAKRDEASKCFFSTGPFRKQPCEVVEPRLYDKILVDVQCTHDGSIKHIVKSVENSWKDFDWNDLLPESLDALHRLQVWHFLTF